MATQAGLIAAIGERYRSGCRAVRGRILDEFAAITGLHRKHAARLLRATHIVDRSKARPDRRERFHAFFQQKSNIAIL